MITDIDRREPSNSCAMLDDSARKPGTLLAPLTTSKSRARAWHRQ
jgi:hypothetical protein